jgi:hypothetical protein
VNCGAMCGAMCGAVWCVNKRTRTVNVSAACLYECDIARKNT